MNESYYINGKYYSSPDHLISLSDRGLLLGDGLFETIRAIGTTPQFLKEHVERLNHSLLALHFNIQLDYHDIQTIADKLLQSRLSNDISALRLTVTRGSGQRGLLFSGQERPVVFMTSEKILLNNKPKTLIISEERRHSSVFLYRHKTLNYLSNVLARVKADNVGADDALFLDENNHVLATTSANLFLYQNDTFFTPPITASILSGIMRRQFIQYINSWGLNITETNLNVNTLKDANGIIITNSLIGAQVVQEIVGVWKNSTVERCAQFVKEFNDAVIACQCS